MIFVTGDTHRTIDIAKIDLAHFPEQEKLTRDDYLIIAGDFGGIWTGGSGDNDILDYHNKKKYTTLFVAGNHENYNALETYEPEIWNGGYVRRIRKNVMQLMNGQVFEINGKVIFTMGGATSIDKEFRVEDESWWAHEEPSEGEFEAAWQNLSRYDNRVDCIVTHTIPEVVRKSAFRRLPGMHEYESGVEKFLNQVLKEVKFDMWYAGHLHMDKLLPEYGLKLLYNSVTVMR